MIKCQLHFGKRFVVYLKLLWRDDNDTEICVFAMNAWLNDLPAEKKKRFKWGFGV